MDLSENIVLIGCKWIYKRKIGVDDMVETYKARLVVKDYNQREDIDYHDIFLSVAMLKFIHILLAIVTYYDYEI